MLPLFPDEKIIVQLKGEVITLTSHRVCYDVNEWQKTYSQSAMLEEIISIKQMEHSNSLWLMLTLICIVTALGALFANHTPAAGTTFFLALIFIAVYQVTKSRNLQIISTVAEMKMDVSGIGKEKINQFINEVEKARRFRLLALNIVGHP